ncbi:type IV secretion system DNA-binding domain-containing protein [Methylobacterium sp.]|uniref:type IV secretion system DNA-binding domain-containing protein n=1 Tax=Methylobacterium sp. TaxID=409 RepID=UPI000C3532EF|nr:type IV secretion system DNA-binding domain-containing protein [Methylobacterium sp.]MBP32587.1 hypothetical protein [Methylobacterium sp.]
MAFGLMPPRAWGTESLQTRLRLGWSSLPGAYGALNEVVARGYRAAGFGVGETRARSVVFSTAGDQSDSLLGRWSLVILCSGLMTLPTALRVRTRTPLRHRAVHVSGGQRFEYADATRYAATRFADDLAIDNPGLALTADLVLPRKRETDGILAIGRSGSGKTVLINTVLMQARARGDRIILHDTKGDVVETWPDAQFYLLTTGDRRSWAWDLAADLGGEEDAIRAFWAILMPADGREPIWALGAREVGVGVIKGLYAAHGAFWGWSDLADILEGEDAALRNFACRYHPPARAFTPLDEEGNFTRTAASYVGNLQGAGNAIIRPLAASWGDIAPAARIGVKAWLLDTAPERRVLVLQRDAAKADLSEAWLKPLLGMMANLCASREMPNGRPHRTWFSLDEMPQLGVLPHFSQVMETGRVKGLCALISAQNLDQIEDTYGPARARALLGLTGLKVAFKLDVDEGSKRVTEFVEDEVVEVWPEPDAKGNRPTQPDLKTIETLTRTDLARLRRTDTEVEGFLFLDGAACKLSWSVVRLPVQRAAFLPFKSQAPAAQPDPSRSLTRVAVRRKSG